MNKRMTEDMQAHRSHAWRVHHLAADFELLDVWSFALGRRGGDLDAVLRSIWGAIDDMARTSWLARARVWIGRVFGWDDRDFTLPIPGRVETSVADRLTATDRADNRAVPEAPSPLAVPRIKTIYLLRDEALYEFSNDTVHGLLHLGVRGSAGTLAVYVKKRGLWSRLYMAAISPFRHLVVYPAFLRHLTAALA